MPLSEERVEEILDLLRERLRDADEIETNIQFGTRDIIGRMGEDGLEHDGSWSLVLTASKRPETRPHRTSK